MKYLITILSLFIMPILVAQDVQKNLEVPKGHNVSTYGFTDNGSFYIVTSKANKDKEIKFKRFNAKTLEIDLAHTPQEHFRFNKSSPKGEAFLYDNYKEPKPFVIVKKQKTSVLLEDGSTKNIETEDWIPNDFVVISDFINKDFYIAIGYEKGRSKFKGKKENKDYKLFRRDLRTFQTSSADLNLTIEISSDGEEKFEHQFVNHSNEDFTLLTKAYSQKDDRGNNPKSVDYILSVYSYDGKLNETRTLTNEIEDKRLNFKNIYMGPGSYKYESGASYKSSSGNMKTFTTTIPQHIAFGNVHHDIDNQTYYTYGIVNGGNSTKNKCVFMLDKFDYQGNKIWSKNYDQPTRKKKGLGFENYVTQVELVDSGSNLALALSDLGNNYVSIIQLNKNNGDITSKAGYENLKPNRTVTFGGMYSSSGTNEVFMADYILKERFGKNIKFDYSTLIGYSIDKEFKGFIDSQIHTKSELNLITKITPNGIVSIVANNKDKNFKLSKFNWSQESPNEGNSK